MICIVLAHYLQYFVTNFIAFFILFVLHAYIISNLFSFRTLNIYKQLFVKEKMRTKKTYQIFENHN